MKHTRIASKLASMAPIACSIAMGIGVWASPASAQESVGGGILESGAWISQGSRIVSRKGQASAVMQTDGRLCLYKGGSQVWCSEDQPHAPGNYYVIMQEDSRLCINEGTGPREDGGQQGNEVWCSENSPLATDNYFLQVDDAGDIGIFVAGERDGRGTTLIHPLHEQQQSPQPQFQPSQPQFQPSQPLTPAPQPTAQPQPQPTSKPEPQKQHLDERPAHHVGNQFID